MKLPNWLIPPTPGEFYCAFVHIWRSWIKVIGTNTGRQWIVCRACGREWTLP